MRVKRTYLTLLAAAVVGGCVLRLLEAGVAGFSSARSLGQTVGGIGAFFLVAALVPTVMVFLSRKKTRSAASPTAVGLVVMAVFAYFSYQGIEAERTLTSFTLPSQQAPNSGALEAPVKYVDQQHGFSVYYESDWVRREPNEVQTKLVVVSPVGHRCWVTVIDNPSSTDENAKEVVELLLKNGKELLERTLTDRFAEAYVASIRPVVISGNHHSALFSYSYRYRTIDIDEIIAVLEVHTPTKGLTYKVGCSTVSDGDLTAEFENEAAVFFRSFMIIPRQD
jgi:hypothetical protein